MISPRRQLGTVVLRTLGFRGVSFDTLGSDVDLVVLSKDEVEVSELSFSGIGDKVGKDSFLFKIVANFKSALCVVSPASSVGIEEDGGLVKILIMSVAACLKKSAVVIFGKGITCGMNVIVSQSLSLRVFGK